MRTRWHHVTYLATCLVYIVFINKVWAQNTGNHDGAPSPFQGGALQPGMAGQPGRTNARTPGTGNTQSGVCRDGWVDGLVYDVETQPVPVCLRVNVNPLTWTQARDACRNDFAFLLKLESPVNIAGTNIIEYMQQRFINHIWTGIHEEERHLVWDELTPYQVRPRNDHLEGQVVANRGWVWDEEVPDDLESVCGELDITSQLLKRKRRAPEDNPDSADPDTMFAPPLSQEVDQGSIADRPFSPQFQNSQALRIAPNQARRQIHPNTNQNTAAFQNVRALGIQTGGNGGNVPGRGLGNNPNKGPKPGNNPGQSGNNGLGHGAGPTFNGFDQMGGIGNQGQGNVNGNGETDQSDHDTSPVFTGMEGSEEPQQGSMVGNNPQGGNSKGLDQLAGNPLQPQLPIQNPTASTFTNPPGMFNNGKLQGQIGSPVPGTDFGTNLDNGSAESDTPPSEVPPSGPLPGPDASIEDGFRPIDPTNENVHAPSFNSPDSAETVSEAIPSTLSVTISQEDEHSGVTDAVQPGDGSAEVKGPNGDTMHDPNDKTKDLHTSINIGPSSKTDKEDSGEADLAISIDANSPDGVNTPISGEKVKENTDSVEESTVTDGDSKGNAAGNNKGMGDSSHDDKTGSTKEVIVENSGEVLPKSQETADGKISKEDINISTEPRKEANSDEEIRKKTSTEVETPGTVGGTSIEDGDRDGIDIPDMEEVLDPAEEISRERVAHTNRQQLMKLARCKKRLPSVCFSYPISVAQKVSSCEAGWYGHVFLDRCYRVLSKATFHEATRTCAGMGGTLASRNSPFHEKLIFMTFQLEKNSGNGVRFWVSPKTTEQGCIAASERRTAPQNCNRKLEAVCEKPAQPKGVHGNYIEPQNAKLDAGTVDDVDSDENVSDDDDEDERDYTDEDVREVQFSIGAKTPNVLQCDLSSNATEFPILWFKDGLLVDAKYRRMARGVGAFPRGSGFPMSPLPEPAAHETTALQFDSSLVTTVAFAMPNRKVKAEMFQGKYWCEIWDSQPFVRRRSRPFRVRYTDVVTFLGSLRVSGISKQEEMLFNMMSKTFQDIKGVETDISALYNSISQDLRRAIPSLLDVLTFSKRVESDPGSLEYFSFLKLNKDYTDEDENRALDVLSRLVKRAVLNMTLTATFSGSTSPGMMQTISLKSTVACPRQTMKDDDSGLVATFPRTRMQQDSASVEMCQQLPAGLAHCKGNYDTGAFWTDVSVKKTCDVPAGTMHPLRITDKLTEMSEMEIDDDNIEEIMEQTAEVIEEALELRAEDVSHVADIIEHSMKATKMNKKVGENILKAMNKLMGIDEAEVAKANIMDFAANRIIRSVEEYAEKAELGKDNNLRMVTPNVALEIWNLDATMVPVIGLAAKGIGSNSHNKPFENNRIATIYNRSQMHEIDLDAAIEIPPSLVRKTASGDKRLYMMVYREGKLFEAAAASYVTEHGTSHAADLGILNSFVISASIGKQKIEGLKERVKTIFRPFEDKKGTPRICAFWDFSLNGNRGGWSREGCTYNGTVNGRDICLCDHLTNFAVLLDFYGQSEPVPEHHEITLSVITLIGLSLSILGLSLTIISFVFFKKLRQGRAQQTLFNLAVALLCSWLVFLTGIRQTHNYYGCMVVSILLHYFILASFMWMLMEAVLQYLTFVKVLGTYVHRFTMKTAIPAWGLPLVPIIVVVSVDYKLYIGGEIYCWMARPAFLYGFAIPTGLIILSNLVIFIITIFSICRRPNGLRSNQSKYKMAITNLQAAVTSFILLGLTWVFGYLAISDARLTFQYIFTILNTLQGFFIFILFVARKKQVRDQWIMLCCKQREREKASRTLSATNSIPSSVIGGNPRTDRSDSTRTTTSFINSSYDSFYLGSPVKRPQYRAF